MRQAIPDQLPGPDDQWREIQLGARFKGYWGRAA